MTRTNFIDHLRVMLTALVLFHHTAITYGAAGGWYWREVEEASNLGLTLFCGVNQAFFMGFFFLLAGYFTPPAFDRKGIVRFLLDRLIRLGIPLFVYGFILGPVTVALAQMDDGTSFIDNLLRLWSRAYFNIGPLWFAEALLIFAAGYGLWRSLKLAVNPTKQFPSHTALLLTALGVGAGAFLIRLVIPLGQELFWLQIGYFASYVVLFLAGCGAWQGRWLEKIVATQAKPWLIVMAIALPVLPLALLLNGGVEGAKGGWNLLAAIYAFWEPLVAWGAILGLLWQFRLRLNQPSPLGTWLAQRAYGVYIVHPPVLVGISLLLHSWGAPPLLKFIAVGSLTCLGCLAVAALLLLIPGARRVL
ncbi:acyltransferase family protein [Anthocerotibacter panamensis]|uniref:acyltransferase family protein n=1 Tax=Anthocerotibacter panamensis TaxID=2857077 RepID=UPI001C40333F|nr:acyltransferase family protein [Anthocerotibacter panamensis]